MQAKIIKFLTDNEFQYPNIAEMVKSPTRTDVARIFEFTYQQLDYRYTLRGRIEEEVLNCFNVPMKAKSGPIMPHILQLLGYPVPLKPSTMQTIGAAHTMHSLLGAITWLIDVVTIALRLEPQDLLLANDDTDGQRTSLAYGFVVNCHKKMKAGGRLWVDKESFKRETENFIQVLEEKEDLCEMFAKLQEKQKEIDDKRAILLKDEGEVANLRNELEIAKKDFRSLQAYKEKLSKAQKLMAEKEECQSRNLEAMINKYKSLNEKVEEVPTAGQIQMMSSQREELKENVQKASDDLEKLEESIRSLKTELLKQGSLLITSYETMRVNFEKNCRLFDADDQSFVNELQERSPHSADFIDFIDQIEAHLIKLESCISAKLASIDVYKNGIECEVEKIRSQNESKKAQLDDCEQSLKREDWANEKGKANLRLDVMQNKVQGLKELRSNVMDAHEELANVKKEQQTQRLKIDAIMKNIALEVTRQLSCTARLSDRCTKSRREIREGEALLLTTVERYFVTVTNLQSQLTQKSSE